MDHEHSFNGSRTCNSTFALLWLNKSRFNRKRYVTVCLNQIFIMFGINIYLFVFLFVLIYIMVLFFGQWRFLFYELWRFKYIAEVVMWAKRDTSNKHGYRANTETPQTWPPNLTECPVTLKCRRSKGIMKGICSCPSDFSKRLLECEIFSQIQYPHFCMKKLPKMTFNSLSINSLM